MESKIVKLRSREQNGGCQELGEGELRRFRSKAPKFQFRKLKEFWSSNVQPGDDRKQYCFIYLKFAKSSHHKNLLSVLAKKTRGKKGNHKGFLYTYWEDHIVFLNYICWCGELITLIEIQMLFETWGPGWTPWGHDEWFFLHMIGSNLLKCCWEFLCLKFIGDIDLRFSCGVCLVWCLVSPEPDKIWLHRMSWEVRVFWDFLLPAFGSRNKSYFII